MVRTLASFFFCIFFVSACAFTPQKASLNPTIDLSESNIGNGKTVALKVIDERPEESLGHRGSAFMKGAEITTDQDVASVIYEEISEALQKQGFSTVPFDEKEKRSLKVEIRLIEYYTSTGFWTGGVHTKSALKAIARNGVDTYDKLYRVENEERVIFVPGAEHNEKIINTVIGDAIEEIFNDNQLLTLLAKE